jgi:hypothetical protein
VPDDPLAAAAKAATQLPSSEVFKGEVSPQPSSMPPAPGLNAVQTLQADASFMAQLTHRDPRVRAPALEKWEKAHMAVAGTPDAKPEHRQTTIENDGDRLEADLSPHSERAYIFPIPEGTKAVEGLDQFRAELFQAKVAPEIANHIWRELPKIEALDHATWQGQVRSAREIVEAQPGGKATIADAGWAAAEFEKRGDLWQRAVAAAVTTPAGILELARLARRANR